mmetsp:Transcript_14338/g.29709  ORF Transcript_14338/g.29709 Transcript_14338/m.29709 type:complete len:158 (-) Transcript_14338:296-769(-)
MVVTVASPTKAAEFINAQDELPMSVFYCSQDLAAYRQLGFDAKFGADGSAWDAAVLPLQRIVERGPERLQFMAEKMENYLKTSPIGLVSGQSTPTMEDVQGAAMLGGAFALVGGEVVFAHRDKAVADHFDLDAAMQALQIDQDCERRGGGGGSNQCE